MTDTKPQTLISGKTIISTMQTISSLGQIGKKILISVGIDEIEAEKWYPHELRILLLNQIYRRFGTDAIYFIGLKNVLLFPEGVKVIRAIGKTYEDSLVSNSSDSNIVLALEDYFRKLVNIFDNSIKVNTRGQHDLFGMGLTKISATHFNIKVSATTDVNHEAFYIGNVVAGLSLFLLSEWKFDIKPKSETRDPQSCMTTYEFEIVFYRHKSEKSSAELLNDLQINAGEALLKKVVLDSDNSLMKLDAAHKVVLESVNYASRLQRGQLPRQTSIDGRFASFASIWEPRDTIGGDLYWLSSSQNQGPFILAVADCTGHGVPGAMLSLLVSNSLERIYANDADEDPAAALISLDHFVRTGLNQDKADSESDDGCDAAVMRIDRDKQTIEFAGAKLGLFQVSGQGDVTRHQGARCSLGYQDAIADKDKPVVQTIHYQAGDTFTVVTDGVTDQIGGANGRTSFGYRRIEAILEAHCTSSAEEITQALSSDFAAWQGANVRRDDVTAVVFRL